METQERGAQFENVNGVLVAGTKGIHEILYGKGLVKSQYHDWKRRLLKRYQVESLVSSTYPIAEDGKQVSSSFDVLVSIQTMEQIAKAEARRKIEQREIWERVLADCQAIRGVAQHKEEEAPKVWDVQDTPGLPTVEAATRSILDLSLEEVKAMKEISKSVNELSLMGLSQEDLKSLSRRLIRQRFSVEI